MKQFNSIVVCIILVSTAVFTPPCSAAEPIYIGLSEPFTGQYAGYGETFKKSDRSGYQHNQHGRRDSRTAPGIGGRR